MDRPAIRKFQPLDRFQLGPYNAVIVGDIEAAGMVQYRYVLMLFEGADAAPIYYVSSEVNEMAGDLGGSHFLCAFEGDRHLNFGCSDEWADYETFARRALQMVAEKFNVPLPALPVGDGRPLKTVDESYTQLVDAERDALVELEKILGGTAIPSVKAVQDYLFGFTVEGGHVTGLGLSGWSYGIGCHLAAFPDAIGQLASLRDLRLDHHHLAALPETLGNLVNLQGLWLNDNQLVSLPEVIGNLGSLQTLVLRNNQLAALPEAIGQLTSLRELRVDENRLAALPEAIGNLASLQTLVLNHNPLGAFPEAIGNLASLQTLDLSSTQLAELPEAIGNLSSLRVLDVSYNPLPALPESLLRLESLKTVYAHVRLRRDEVVKRLIKRKTEITFFRKDY